MVECGDLSESGCIPLVRAALISEEQEWLELDDDEGECFRASIYMADRLSVWTCPD